MSRLRVLDDREVARVIALYRDHGVTTKALSERFSCHRSLIQKVLRSAGIDLGTGRREWAGVGGHGISTSRRHGIVR